MQSDREKRFVYFFLKENHGFFPKTLKSSRVRYKHQTEMLRCVRRNCPHEAAVSSEKSDD